MSPRLTQRADLSRDGRLTEVGKGGEGTVFDIEGRPDVVYKEYLPRTGLVLNRGAIEDLITVPARFSERHRNRILERTAWPNELVLDGDRVVGYLMPRIPAEYWRTHGAPHDPRRVACDWNYLTHRAQWQKSDSLVSDVPRIGITEILRLIADFAELMAILHTYEIVIGDVSGRNILWTDRPSLAVFLIDCDAFRPEGSDAVNPPKESPDWGDPSIDHSRTTRSSDVYKLALATYRSLWSQSSRFPPMSPNPIPEVPDAVVDLVWRSLAPEGRPSADEWARTIRQIIQFGDRPLVQLSRRTAATSRPEPATDAVPDVAAREAPGGEERGGGSRPVIPVR